MKLLEMLGRNPNTVIPLMEQNTYPRNWCVHIRYTAVYKQPWIYCSFMPKHTTSLLQRTVWVAGCTSASIRHMEGSWYRVISFINISMPVGQHMYRHSTHSVTISRVCGTGTAVTVAGHNRDHCLCSSGTTVTNGGQLTAQLKQP